MQLTIYLHKLHKNVEVRIKEVVVIVEFDILSSNIVEALTVVPGMEYPFKVLTARYVSTGKELPEGWLSKPIGDLVTYVPAKLTIVYE